MQLAEIYEQLGNGMTITPALAPGVWEAGMTGLLSAEGHTIKAICTVPAGDGTDRPVLWTIEFDAELPSTAPAALASLGCSG